MSKRRHITKSADSALPLIAFFAAGLLASRVARAMPSDPPSLLAASCGVVQTVEGDVQILDESRTTTHEARRNEILPCGSWISATRGNLGFKHAEGHVVRLSSGAFVQVKARQSGDDSGIGGVVLFKGMLYVKASETGPEFELATSNGRIVLEPGAIAMAIWDDSQEETQLIGLEGISRFENRFQSGTTVRVAGGEASSLNFKLVRVMPSDPAPVPVANVKLKLADFRLDYAERDRLLAQVEKRGERQILVNLGPVPRAAEAPAAGPKPIGLVTRVNEDKQKGRLVLEERIESMDSSEVSRLSPNSQSVASEVSAASRPEAPAAGTILSAKPDSKRAPAAARGADETSGSAEGAGAGAEAKLNLSKKSEYRTHPGVDDDQAEEMQRALARKLAGDDGRGDELEGLVHPDDYRASDGRQGVGGGVEVSDVEREARGGRRSAKVSSREEAEKRRLINELSKLKVEP